MRAETQLDKEMAPKLAEEIAKLRKEVEQVRKHCDGIVWTLSKVTPPNNKSVIVVVCEWTNKIVQFKNTCSI